MEVGSFVVIHLVDPGEKYWGVVLKLDSPGLTFRGINVESFDDWMTSVASERDPSMGLVSIFVPLRRIECVFLDERVGEVESYCERFERRVGVAVTDYLGIGDGASSATTH
ncbi:MAG: hypothetical protein AAGD38_12880 [Acidobacteriota bacterium]